ncbi:hypothetical protein FQR65_LT03639 [Abscondita terminalis]|nr:hypothetical protein FQR65_LT03639 [Abscondita terminalis]
MWTLALICILLINSLLSSDIFDIFKKCKINDQACLKTSINKGLPKLANGLETINLPPLDPYIFGNSVTDENGFLQEYFNLTFIGFSNVDVLNIKIDLDFCRINLDLDLPRLLFDTGAHWKGDLDGNEVDLNFLAKMYCDNNNVKSLLNCKKVKKNELDYIEIVNGQTDLHFGNVTFSLTDTVGDKQHINKYFTGYFNENSEAEALVTKPAVDKNLGRLIQFVTNKIFSKIPLSELFLE